MLIRIGYRRGRGLGLAIVLVLPGCRFLRPGSSGRCRPAALPMARLSDHQLRDLGLPPRDPPQSADLWPAGRP